MGKGEFLEHVLVSTFGDEKGIVCIHSCLSVLQYNVFVAQGMGTNTNVKFFEKTRYQWDIQKETDNAMAKIDEKTNKFTKLKQKRALYDYKRKLIKSNM